MQPASGPLFRYALIAVSSAWIAFELWLVAFRRSDASATRKDVGTLKVLNLVIYASVTAAAIVSNRASGHVAVPQPLLWCALLLIAGGVAIRLWAIRSLRRFFTVDLAVHADHRLVESGPYRRVRHPAYSGVLLSFLGLAICMSNWISAAILLAPITAVFLHRVRVEERLLNDALPGYAEYSARTDRLIPGLF